MKLVEMFESKHEILLESVCFDLNKAQRTVVEGIYNDLLPLIEASLSPQQIQQIFANVEQQASAGGGNKTLLGKGVDVAKKTNEIVNKIGKWLQDTAPVKAFDQKFEDLKKQVVDKLGTDSKIVTGIEKLSVFAKENPGKTAAIIGVMTALAAIAGGPAGGAIAGQVLRGSVELLKGEKLSTAIGKGAKTAAIGAGLSWLAGISIDTIKGAFEQAKPVLKQLPVEDLIRYTKNVNVNGRSVLYINQVMPKDVAIRVKEIGEEAWKNLDSNPSKAASLYAKIDGIINDTNLKKKVADMMANNETIFAKNKELQSIYQDALKSVNDHNDSVNQFASAIKSIASGAIQGSAAASGIKPKTATETYSLTEMETEALWNNIAGAVGKKIGQTATNLTSVVTADKLNKAWKAAGSPTDSKDIENFLSSQGVDKTIISQSMSGITKTKGAAPAGSTAQSGSNKMPALDKSRLNKIFMGIAQDLAAGGGSTTTATTAAAKSSPSTSTASTASAPAASTSASTASAPAAKTSTAQKTPAAGGSMVGKAAQAIGKVAGQAVKGAKTGYQQGMQGIDQPAQAGVKGQKLKGQVNVGTLSKLFPNIDQQALTKAVMTVKSGQAPSRAHMVTLASLAAEMIKADPKTTVAAANVLRSIRADQQTA